MQEGRARENAILLRLGNITSAASSAFEQRSKSCSSALSKTFHANPIVDLQLPADDLRHTESHHHMAKLQGLNAAAGKSTGVVKDLKAKEATREPGKSGGSVHRDRSRKTLAQVGARAIKGSMGMTDNQGGGSELIAGGQSPSQCDLVVFPGSAVQVTRTSYSYSAAVL